MLNSNSKQDKNNHSQDATIVVDQEGIIHSINEEALRLLNLNQLELIGKGINNLLPQFNVLSANQGSHELYDAICANGEIVPVFLVVNTFEMKGKLYSLLILHKGYNNYSSSVIEPRKELVDIKNALDESTIVAITDQTGKIKYVNDKFCEISQFSKEELIGQDHRVINSGYHSKAFMRNLWRTIARGSVWHGEIKNKAKDGSFYWVDTTIVPFLNDKGKPYQYLAIRHEITEYKRVVNELERSLGELVDIKFALDESSIVAITDKRGRITYINDQFVQVSKYSREELLGSTHAIINSGHHPKSFFKDLWKTIGNGKVWKGEIKNQAKDGTYYWVDTTIVPFLDDAGKPYQYLAIRFEITSRKRVEEELKHTMTRIINVQEEERKRLSRELHDGIGQNLYSHLITINRLSAELDHPLLTQMLEESTELIQEVRDFSWELRPSVLDDLGLVPAIRSFLNRFSESYDIDIVFECYLENRLNNNIEITIYRIIQESLTNIRKYAKVDQATITIREVEQSVRVVIEDKGRGFDTTKLASGVGLISMGERAKSVNGELEVNSEIEKGTKIVLEIPL